MSVSCCWDEVIGPSGVVCLQGDSADTAWLFPFSPLPAYLLLALYPNSPSFSSLFPPHYSIWSWSCFYFRVVSGKISSEDMGELDFFHLCTRKNRGWKTTFGHFKISKHVFWAQQKQKGSKREQKISPFFPYQFLHPQNNNEKKSQDLC